MEKLRTVSLVVLSMTVLLWTAGRTVLPLPDWAVRVNGVVMLAALALLVFSSVRLKVKES